ncbi:glycosyltransferase [Rhodococcus sp. BP22]|uniref:glycosyltransferase n=1 Tax=Rhodococcus sp. BP22 TaxID=2758566 RepID=UPI0016485C40|nr:glycosyltransferase [Rhodococcus sp. BP22]
MPGVETYTQHSSWNLKKWTYIGSLLDKWTVSNSTPIERPLKVFVTLGTIKPYVFERAVDAVLEILRPSDSVVWQLGTSWRDGLPGESFRELTSEEVDFNIRHADVVITHAGVGSIINILDAGSSPVLAIRKKRYNEHIDDHQQQIADTMVKRGLAQALDLERPDRSTLLTAAYRTVETRSNDE